MKKARLLALVLALAAISNAFSSCGGGGENDTAVTDGGEITQGISVDVRNEYTLDVAWLLGYVGSESNPSYKQKINELGSLYSYSDVIHIPKKGSTISFTDDNSASGGDTGFASNLVYVFSSWNKGNTNYTLNKDGNNLDGESAEQVNADGKRTYSYTTSSDDEYVRLCFRSGNTAEHTPESYPSITVRGDAEPTVDVIEATSTSRPGETLDVRFHTGYIGSEKNSSGYANKINDTAHGYVYSDVITLAAAGTKLKFTAGNGDNMTYAVSSWVKNESDEWVIDGTGVNVTHANSLIRSDDSGDVTYTYISEKENENIRLCLPSEETEGIKIYKSKTSADSTAEQIRKEALEYWAVKDADKTYYDVLKGRTFTVIGDSYLAGNGLDKTLVWPALLAKKYGMTYLNYGVNGSTISNYVTTNDPMVSRYKNMKDNDPDIVVIEGGRNDYNKSVPLGDKDSRDTKTMMGASRYLIEELQKKYPNATIICLTVWEVGGAANSVGLYCSDYGKALIEVCESMGVPCINAMDQKATGVYMTDQEFRSQYCMKPTDISHLNADGMKLVFPVFEKYIAQYCTQK